MAEDYKYKAFISYSHKDKNFAKWLHRRIENYKIPSSLREKYPNLPKNLQRSVFRDEDELPTASELSDNLLNAMDNSERLIVICSPSSVKSKWVNSEIKYFKHKHGENFVLAIIKDGEPNATDMDDKDNEAFPHALKYIVNQEGDLTEKRTEPIAGDARSYWDKEMAAMKMIAGILKVDFADLWRRERRERNKYWLITLGVVSIFIALSIYASTQFVGEKVNKELEKINSEIAMIEYNIRHDNLEYSILLELNKKLKKLKKQKETKEDTQRTLGNLKTSLGKEAQEVYRSKGVKEAIKVFTSKKALARKEQLIKELSLEDIALAKLYVEGNNFVKAKKSYEDAISLFYSYENVKKYADFLHKQNEYDKEIKLYNELLKEKLNERQERDIYRFLVYSMYKKKTVNFEETKEKNILIEKYLKKSLKLARKLVEKQSTDDIYVLSMLLKDNGVFYTDKITTYKDGKLGVDKKVYDEVEDYFEESLELSKKLLDIEKDNNNYHSLYAATLFNQGKLYSRVPTYNKAEKLYYRSLSVYEKLMIKNSQIYGSNIESVLSQIYWMIYMMNLTDTEARKKAHLDMLTKYRKLAKKSPSVYCTHYKSITFKVAHNYKKHLAFNEADLIYKIAYNVCPDDSVFNKFVIEQQLINLYTDSKQLSELEKIYQNLQYNKKQRYTNQGVILDRLASMYSEFNKFDQAEEFYKKEIEFYKKETEYYEKNNQNYMEKTSRSLIAYAYESLGRLYKKYQKTDLEFSSYKDTLLIFKDLAKTNPNKYEGEVGRIIAYLGSISFQQEKYENAENFYKESIHILKKIVLIRPQKYMVSLATSVDMISVIYSKTQKHKEAIRITEELVEIIKQVTYLDFTLNLTDAEASNLMRLGSLYKEDKQLNKAEKVFIEALSKYRKLSKQDANSYMKHIAYALRELGDVKSRKGEYKVSESYYKESLMVYKGLAKKEPSIHNPNIAWTINRLGNMYKQNIELEKAEKYYDIALSILPSIYNDKIAYEFDMLGKLYEKNKKFNEAEKVYIKSLSIYKGLAEKNKKIYNTYISWVLGRIGEVYSETKEYDKAIKMHSNALIILESEENKTIKTYNDLLWTLSRLGELYEENSQNKKAKEVYTKALTISTELAKKDVNYNADIASITSKLQAL